MRPIDACVLAVLASGVASAADRPLDVANAGFEEGTDAGADAWGWWSRTGAGSASRTDREAHAGKHSVLIVHEAERDWNYSSTARFTVAPAQAYAVSAWVKLETGRVYVAAVGLKGDATVNWDIGSGETRTPGTWQKITGIAEVPEGCDRMCVRFGGSGPTRVYVDDVELVPASIARAAKAKVDLGARARVAERIDRGAVALRLSETSARVSWRLLKEDAPGIAFEVLRRTPGGQLRTLTARPVSATTDFTDSDVPDGQRYEYLVRPAGADAPSGLAVLHEASATDACITIPLERAVTFQKVGIGDLDGDGRYDYVVKTPNANIDPWHLYWQKSPDTYVLEARRGDGSFLWRYDMGWAIERGIWYSPYLVADLDGDGRAEIVVKSGDGDPRGADGKVESGPEYVTVLDGLTARPRARADWPGRANFTMENGYNYASRNQLAVAYLDGMTPCLIVLRGTYNVMLVDAYVLRGSSLAKLWSWDNRALHRRYRGQGAHWTQAADVDGDGRDEILLGSAMLDDNGVELWSTGLGHADHAYLGDLDPRRPGLEIYYGIEPARPRDGMCMVDALTGRILWGHDSPTVHIHAQGLVSDVDPAHPGAECSSGERDDKAKRWLRSSDGATIQTGELGSLALIAAWWDADPQREIVRGRRLVKHPDHTTAVAQFDGSVVAVADVLGDWREEVFVTKEGQLKIYVSPVPARDRRVCLMQDPFYRSNVTHAAMGYYQVPTPSYDMASGK